MKKVVIFILILFICCSVWARSYTAVDARAAKAPAVSSRDKLDELVNYLTEPFQKQEDKARAILTWIVKNIDYDDYKFNQNQKAVKRTQSARDFSVPESDILEVHMGVCHDITNLYITMAQKAGLTARYVGGYAGNDLRKANLDEYRHAWVIVTIDGKEKFVDPTWAINGGGTGATARITNNTRYIAELNRRKDKNFRPNKSRVVDEAWFLTEPKDMIKTHFPDNAPDQLLQRPISLNQFLSRIH